MIPLSLKLQNFLSYGEDVPPLDFSQFHIACLTGEGECTSGDAASMTLVEATEEDVTTAREALESEVLPEWAERAGTDWAKRWNDSVGQVVGVTIGG